jgi:hypothetical protein
MPFPRPLAYLRYEFSWNGGQDIQECGMFLMKQETGDWPAPGPLEYAQEIAEKGVDAWKTNMGGGFYAPAVTATQCTAYTMKADGRHVDQKGVAPFSGSNAWSGSGSGTLPAENSVVLSLYGYDPATYGGTAAGQLRGRMYLPTPAAASLDSTGMVTASIVDTQLEHWQDWYDDITGALTGGIHVRPVIRSLGGKYGPEGAAEVGWWRMGRLVDTQRRRRNKLDEDYHTVPVT